MPVELPCPPLSLRDDLPAARLWNTIEAAALSVVIALPLGAALGVARLSDHAWPAGVDVDFFRAIPVLILMLFVFALWFTLFSAYVVIALIYIALNLSLTKLAAARERRLRTRGGGTAAPAASDVFPPGTGPSNATGLSAVGAAGGTLPAARGRSG